MKFDLYTQKGLGRVADLICIPVEVDEFTRRMTSLEVAHLKVKVDCTEPLPYVAELERDDGEIVRLSIDYPWIPPICPCCKELGHLEAMCPNVEWSPKPQQTTATNAHPASSPKSVMKTPVDSHVSTVVTGLSLVDSGSSVTVTMPGLSLADSGLSPSSSSKSPDGLILSQSNLDLLVSSSDQITHLLGLPAHPSSRPRPFRAYKNVASGPYQLNYSIVLTISIDLDNQSSSQNHQLPTIVSPNPFSCFSPPEIDNLSTIPLSSLVPSPSTLPAPHNPFPLDNIISHSIVPIIDHPTTINTILFCGSSPSYRRDPNLTFL